jgi:hypothetical protein
MHGTADEVLPYGGQDTSVASPLPLPALPALPARLGEWAIYRINGGTHQAPHAIAGRPVAEVVWEFFAAHPLPG